jgi:hypothetical protein
MEDQEKKEVFINPTLKLNPNDYELGFRINGDIDTCACGKEIQCYYTISEVVARTKEEGGYVSKKKRRFWEHHAYPEIHCHCRCGKRWAEHL